MNEIVQLQTRSNFKVKAGYRPPSCFSRLDHVQRKPPPSYSVQQRLHKTECHSALDRLDFERFASQPMPRNS